MFGSSDSCVKSVVCFTVSDVGVDLPPIVGRGLDAPDNDDVTERQLSAKMGKSQSISQLYILFSPLGKLAGRAIYFTDVFFFIFLMVDFLAPVAQTLMEQSSPKFQD